MIRHIRILCLIIALAIASSASAANIYHDINPANDTSLADVTGGLIVHVKACGSAEDLLIFIARNGTDLPPFDNYYHPDRTLVDGENPGYAQIQVLQDCASNITRLTPGTYNVFLRNGNGGQPEQQQVIVNARYTSDAVFLGHAVSSRGLRPATVSRLDILHATWGAGQERFAKQMADTMKKINGDS